MGGEASLLLVGGVLMSSEDNELLVHRYSTAI